MPEFSVKKWADKYHIKINVIQINDYVGSLNQFTAGKIDAVTAANMDALTVPAAGGVDTSAILIGDFSNGNDGIVVKKGDGVASLKRPKDQSRRALGLRTICWPAPSIRPG